MDHRTTPQIRANILKREMVLGTFVTTPDREPTNNAAERAFAAVVWRPSGVCARSLEGSRFAARPLTVGPPAPAAPCYARVPHSRL